MGRRNAHRAGAQSPSIGPGPDTAFDSADGRIYLAASLPGLNGTGYLARSDVGGSSWTMMTGAPVLGSLAADPFAPGTLIGTTKLEGFLVRSTDSAATWTSSASQPGGTLVFDPAKPGRRPRPPSCMRR